MQPRLHASLADSLYVVKDYFLSIFYILGVSMSHTWVFALTHILCIFLLESKLETCTLTGLYSLQTWSSKSENGRRHEKLSKHPIMIMSRMCPMSQLIQGRSLSTVMNFPTKLQTILILKVVSAPRLQWAWHYPGFSLVTDSPAVFSLAVDIGP